VTQADLERRIRHIEETIGTLERQLAVLATGIAIARWVGPFSVSVAAVVIVLLKG
jgi:hypothetical protein